MNKKELWNLGLTYGRNARDWKKKFVALLPEIAKYNLHKEHGFQSIYEYAAKVGGVGRKTVEYVFQVQKHIEDKPALKEALPKVGIHKIRTIATLATKENQQELAKKVQTMSKSALELYAREQKAPKLEIPPGGNLTLLSFHVELKVELELRKLKEKGETFNDVMKKLLAMVPKEKEVKPRKVKKSKSRPAPAQKRREVLAKTNGKCSIPNCNRPAEEIHHPKPWAKHKSHDELEPLCKPHHELAHQSDSTIDKKFRADKLQPSMF
jgi:hypothetical protein